MPPSRSAWWLSLFSVKFRTIMAPTLWTMSDLLQWKMYFFRSWTSSSVQISGPTTFAGEQHSLAAGRRYRHHSIMFQVLGALKMQAKTSASP